MTSGKRLTERQRDSILRLAGYQTVDGEWTHTYDEIAAKLEIDSRTVTRQIRIAAVQWGLFTRWHAEPLD